MTSWLRPGLWLLLILSVAANAVASSLDLSVVVYLGFGLVTLACAVVLAVHHYQHR